MENLNTSFRTNSQDEYDKKWLITRACYGLVRGLKNTGRGIVYPFKKVGNSLWNGLRGCCLGFKDGCAEGWNDITFTRSQYGLPKEGMGMMNNNV